MAVVWSDDLARLDWDELAVLSRAAPLGDKSAADLRLVFENSRFRVFAFEAGMPGREPVYEAFGFRRMTTVMTTFENPAKVHQSGYLERL